MKRKLRKADRKKLSHALSAALGVDVVVEKVIVCPEMQYTGQWLHCTGREKLTLTVREK
ncbi:MAG TPA: hypothetical protein PLH32_18125 [bacterium]|nr:hypothetical protein [bacterium]